MLPQRGKSEAKYSKSRFVNKKRDNQPKTNKTTVEVRNYDCFLIHGTTISPLFLDPGISQNITELEPSFLKMEPEEEKHILRLHVDLPPQDPSSTQFMGSDNGLSGALRYPQW